VVALGSLRLPSGEYCTTNTIRVDVDDGSDDNFDGG